MNLITCAVATLPCPVDQQQALSALTLELLAALGFTSQTVLSSFLFGFGLVLAPAVIGIAVSAAVKGVRSL